MSKVESFIAAMEPPAARETVAAVRRLVLAAHEGLTEHIKWNGPSFCFGGDDRITLGLDRTGAVRVVLHRGAKARDGADFVIDDDEELVPGPPATGAWSCSPMRPRWRSAPRPSAVWSGAGSRRRGPEAGQIRFSRFA